MRISPLPILALLGPLLIATPKAEAAEYAFSSYGMGGASFGAGVTPPPGIYVTAVSSFYNADIASTIVFGGVTVNAGAHVEAFSSAWNILYVPQRKVLGASLGLALTVPVGHIDVEADVSVGGLPVVARQTDGWGLGDTVVRAQLGWDRGDFSHILYVQVVAPTGRWDPGFSPIVGLHRPGIDTGYAVTWTDKASKIQINGAAGVTFNFENTETNYRTGDEFHFEWAIGREIMTGLVFGVVGYDYRQLTGDSGSGALLGPLKGKVDAIGPGLSYTTLIDRTPLVLSARHYWEFNADKRWEGASTILSATMRF